MADGSWPFAFMKPKNNSGRLRPKRKKEMLLTSPYFLAYFTPVILPMTILKALRGMLRI